MGSRGGERVGRAYWDRYAADYAEHAERSAFNALYDRPAVLGLLGDVTGQRVLDVGCVPGLYAAELVSLGAIVVRLDQSPEMVRLARRRLAAAAAAGGAAELRRHDPPEPVRRAPARPLDPPL